MDPCIRRLERVGRTAKTDRPIPTNSVTSAAAAAAAAALSSSFTSALTPVSTSAVTSTMNESLGVGLNEPFDGCMRRINYQQAVSRGHLDDLPRVARPNPNRVALVCPPCSAGSRRGFARLRASSLPSTTSASTPAFTFTFTSLCRYFPWPLPFVAARVPRGTRATAAVSAATVAALPLERHPTLAADERDVDQPARRQHLGRRCPGQKVWG